MITGKLYGGLSIIGEAILLKELPDNEVMILVIDLPSPIEAMPLDQPHGCNTIVWKASKGSAAIEGTLVYVPNN